MKGEEPIIVDDIEVVQTWKGKEGHLPSYSIGQKPHFSMQNGAFSNF